MKPDNVLEEERAFTGALLWTEHIDNMRAIRQLLENTAKASQKSSGLKRYGRR